MLSIWHSVRSQAAAKMDALASNGIDEIEVPAFLGKLADCGAMASQTSALALLWPRSTRPPSARPVNRRILMRS
jgi:hypothetical protein